MSTQGNCEHDFRRNSTCTMKNDQAATAGANCKESKMEGNGIRGDTEFRLSNYSNAKM